MKLRVELTKWSQRPVEDQKALAQRLGNSLSELREHIGVTVRDVQRESGFSLGYLSDVEHGRRWPTYESAWALESALRRLAEARGVEVSR